LARTLAAALRSATGLEGSTLAQRKAKSSGSTERSPSGKAAKASNRRLVGWAGFRAIFFRASANFGALVFAWESARAVLTASWRIGSSFCARQEPTAFVHIAGTVFT